MKQILWLINHKVNFTFQKTWIFINQKFTSLFKMNTKKKKMNFLLNNFNKKKEFRN